MNNYFVNWQNGKITSIDYDSIRYYIEYDFEPNYDPDNGDGTYLFESFLIKENDKSDIRYLCYLESTNLLCLENIFIIYIDEIGW